VPVPDSCVTRTHLCLPRDFLERIQFTQAVRSASELPPDPDLLRLFQEMAPQLDWAKAHENPARYEPPRWMGYWQARDTYWASDGVLKLAVRSPEPMADLFAEVQREHFSGTSALPFVGASLRDPSHMLVHDTEQAQLFVAAFEQAEALLVRQGRLSG
jgi:hypothetical protein